MIAAERLAFLDDIDEATKRATDLWDDKQDFWTTDNSDLRDYAMDLRLGEPWLDLPGIIRAQIGQKPENVGIDIAGGHDGVALQDLLRAGLLGKALVTNLAEYYHAEDTAGQFPTLDQQVGHILERDTWEGTIAWQEQHAPDGLALVMHRPQGSLQNLSPEVYEVGAHLLLDMLGPGGLMFTQIPDALVEPVNRPVLRDIHAGIASRDDIGLTLISIGLAGLDSDERVPRHAIVVKHPVMIPEDGNLESTQPDDII